MPRKLTVVPGRFARGLSDFKTRLLQVAASAEGLTRAKSPARPILLGMACLIVAFLGFFTWMGIGLAPVKSRPAPDVSVVVPVGAGLGRISAMLENAHLIRAPFAFEVYARLTGAERRLRAGDYRLSPSMSGRAILQKLTRGEQASVMVTFPEGVTDVEIARILAEKGLVNEQQYLKFLSGPDFAATFSDLTDAKSPEGFMFPDTYRIRQGAALAEIAAMQIRRFREVFTPEMVEQAHRQGMTIEEVVTLASIIEKEAKVPNERPMISAVFRNRLRLGRPLESCATVQYALGVHKSRLSYKDLRVDSPYNTYRHTGLPPGPIANPGLDSIKAALFPAKVNYLYFVARDDGTHVFSRTYSEHLKAQRQIASRK